MKIGNIELLNCDNLEFLRNTADKAFELAIVDPPYNIASQQKRGVGSRIDASGKMNQWNNATPSNEYFTELFRVSKGQIIWGANNYVLPVSEYFCVWNKHQTVDNFASAEYAWVSPSLKKPAKVFEMTIHAHNSSKGEKIHPTMKPIALYKWLLHNYAKEGDKILDTHLGSGSIAIACHDYKFELTGCEIDKDYFDAAVKRLQNHVAQTVLF